MERWLSRLAVMDFRFLAALEMTGRRGWIVATSPFCLPLSPAGGEIQRGGLRESAQHMQAPSYPRKNVTPYSDTGRVSISPRLNSYPPIPEFDQRERTCYISVNPYGQRSLFKVRSR